jgi:hypothetical protein
MAIFKYNPYKRKRSCPNSTYAAAKKRRLAVRGTYTVPVYKTVNMTTPSNKVELKMDYGALSFSIPAAGSVSLISTIGSGSDWNERIGRLINYHSLQMKYYLNKSIGHDATTITVSVVYDKQTNGVVPSFTDIFQNADVNSFIKSTNRNRFVVLWQRTHSTSNGSTGQDNVNPHANININLKGKKATFSGITDTISSIESGGIFLTTIANNGAAAIDFEAQNVISFHE